MASAQSARRWTLASHVRTCECDGNVILLDLRSSRYLGIGGPASLMLASHVDNWPSCTAPACAPLGLSAAEDLIGKLSQQGLLADASAAPRTATSADAMAGDMTVATVDRLTDFSPAHSIQEATSTIVLDTDPACAPTAARRFMDALQFTHSVASASCGLRCRSLLAISRTLAVRRARVLGPRAESLEAMTPAVAAYERLRPFLFTARAQCLLDSLALLGFLARSGFAARWVVGVRTGPFAAHSWVQHGSTVLNDQHEYVRQFRPIHVV